MFMSSVDHVYWFRATGGYICGRPSNLVYSQCIHELYVSVVEKIGVFLVNKIRVLQEKNLFLTPISVE